MAKFCGKCGTRLDEATGLCPNCNAEKLKPQTEQSAEPPKRAEKKPEVSQQQNPPLTNQEAKEKAKAEKAAAKKDKKAQKKAAKKAKKKEKWAKKPWWKKLLSSLLRGILWLLLLAILAAGVLFALLRIGLVDMSVIDHALASLGLTEQHQVESIDANEYFQNNATVIEVIDASTSKDVLTEAEVFALLDERGFAEYPITCQYTMDGTYDAQMSFSNQSSTKHPTYETYYITANGEVWTIFVINGAVMARPVSYILQSGQGTEVLLSETNTLMSYDGVTNQFYETIPNDSAVDLKTVDSIDAQTLDGLTYGEIDGL